MFKITKKIINVASGFDRNEVIQHLPLVAAVVATGVGIVSTVTSQLSTPQKPTTLTINNYHIREVSNAKVKE